MIKTIRVDRRRGRHDRPASAAERRAVPALPDLREVGAQSSRWSFAARRRSASPRRWAVALGAKALDAGLTPQALRRAPRTGLCQTLAATRPTAVNLFWAIERMRRVVRQARSERRRTRQSSRRLVDRGARGCTTRTSRPTVRWADIGAELIPDGATVLTHCNAGALATAGYGTALGVIRAAVEAGKRVAVYRGRDAAVPPGRAADRLGAQEGSHPRDARSPTTWRAIS